MNDPDMLQHQLQSIRQAVAVHLVLGDAFADLRGECGQVGGVEQMGDRMAKDVGQPRHRLVPVFQVGQRLLLKFPALMHPRVTRRAEFVIRRAVGVAQEHRPEPGVQLIEELTDELAVCRRHQP